MHMLTGTLSAAPPFDFAQSLKFLGVFQPTAGEQSTEGQSLTKAFTLDGQVIAFRLESRGTVDNPLLACTLYKEQTFSEGQQARAEDEIRFYLSLGDDLKPFYTIGRDDPHFSPVIDYLYGYHQVKFSTTAFENAVWAILSQRNYLPIASRMKTALVERYGEKIELDGEIYPAFPEAGRLALASGDEIAGVIGHRPKGQLVRGVAEAFDRIDESWLRDAPMAEVERWLRSIKGIGEWSASFILLRGLGRVEQMPVGEKRIMAAASKVYGLGADPDNETIARLGKPYSAWIGYWAHYLRAAM